MNIHYLIIGIALLFAIVAIVRPAVWPLPVAVILIAIELFSRVSKSVIIIGLFMILGAATIRADDTNTTSTTTNTATVLGGISEIWTALTTASGTNVDITRQTNWAVIPYIAYDIEKHKVGYGGAILYAVTPNFWAGVRAENVARRQTTAGVQAQLQVTKKVFGLTVTPFIETSVGIGKSAMYGSAGPGALINFHTWVWSKNSLSLGVVGDYEHYVMGDLNGNQANGGLMVRFSF